MDLSLSRSQKQSPTWMRIGMEEPVLQELSQSALDAHL